MTGSFAEPAASSRHRTKLLIALCWMLPAAAVPVWLWMAFARFHTVHNQTFDLAFYARMAWGMVHLVPWVSILNAPIVGLHISPVLIPLGALGAIFGTVPVLLVAQVAAVVAALWPLMRFASRRLGSPGAFLVCAAWVLYPNLTEVLTSEFHPGTIALLPLAWALEALDRKDAKLLYRACIGVLMCREDLALMTSLLASIAWLEGDSAQERVAQRIIKVSLIYFAIFVLILHPIFAPPGGSMEQHFGRFGKTFSQALFYVVTHPLDLIAYLFSKERITYLPLITMPLLGLAWLSPKWMVCALPILAINLLSQFPGTLDLGSHYLTPALAPLMFASIDGLSRIVKRVPSLRNMLIVSCLSSLAAFHYYKGASPISKNYQWSMFHADTRTVQSRALLALIGPDTPLQAPDALLPHLAERVEAFRQPPPDQGGHIIVLDISHRDRFLHDDGLIRVDEEPNVRNWMARPKYGEPRRFGPWLMLRKWRSGRKGDAARYFVKAKQFFASDQPLTRCLSVNRARWETSDGNAGTQGVALYLTAHEACAHDLALRFGVGFQPRRVDLLFDGLLSPAWLRKGDILRSWHEVSYGEKVLIDQLGLNIGLVRTTGARPEPHDPTSVRVIISEQ